MSQPDTCAYCNMPIETEQNWTLDHRPRHAWASDCVAALRAVLREVEWDGVNAEESLCGVCYGSPDAGHAPSCRLKAALGEG